VYRVHKPQGVAEIKKRWQVRLLSWSHGRAGVGQVLAAEPGPASFVNRMDGARSSAIRFVDDDVSVNKNNWHSRSPQVRYSRSLILASLQEAPPGRDACCHVCSSADLYRKSTDSARRQAASSKGGLQAASSTGRVLF
jgi:hypothetical protein